MSDTGELGMVDSCKECRGVKWAGYSDLCPKCKAKMVMYELADKFARPSPTDSQEPKK
ncbi:MAG TPA: hypothetical protein VFG68_16430 [Fimbriiglobus sp.]|nr:hypothetical protein [Fimbriiglobus sp.]